MKKLVSAALFGALLSMPAMAAEQLTPSQMDQVSAGLLNFFSLNLNATGQSATSVAAAGSGGCVVCLLGGNAVAVSGAQNNNATAQF